LLECFLSFSSSSLARHWARDWQENEFYRALAQQWARDLFVHFLSFWARDWQTLLKIALSRDWRALALTLAAGKLIHNLVKRILQPRILAGSQQTGSTQVRLQVFGIAKISLSQVRTGAWKKNFTTKGGRTARFTRQASKQGAGGIFRLGSRGGGGGFYGEKKILKKKPTG